MQTIFIKDLKLYAYHGVYETEKKNGQRFLLNIQADIDTKGKDSDKIEETLDYGKLCEFIQSYFVETNKNLLENLVEGLAKATLERFREIQKIEIEVGKPDVDLPYTFSNIGIKGTKERHTAYLGIGSNMGDKRKHLDRAIALLTEHPAISDLRVSGYLQTEPYGYTEQEDFLNAAIEVRTYLSPYELLDLCHAIEADANRERKIHWGPRTLDLDILLYDDCMISSPNLCIPHVDMQHRSFVLDPLCELNPYVYHPVLQKRAIELKEELEKSKNTVANS